MNPVPPLSGDGGGVIAEISGVPSANVDVPKWVGTNPDGTFNLRWESDIATAGAFPDAGGIALLDFGSAADTQDFSWPSGTPTIEGENPNLWDYTPGSQVNAGDSGTVAASLIFNGTDPISLGDSRIDGDIVITELGVGNTINPIVRIATNSSPTPQQVLYEGTIAETVNANGTYRFTSTNLIDAHSLTNGSPLFIFLSESSGTAFTYDITDIRLSFSDEEFVAAGAGDTTFVQHTDTPEAYTGAGGALVRVNGAETCLLYTSPSPRDS